MRTQRETFGRRRTLVSLKAPMRRLPSWRRRWAMRPAVGDRAGGARRNSDGSGAFSVTRVASRTRHVVIARSCRGHCMHSTCSRTPLRTYVSLCTYLSAHPPAPQGPMVKGRRFKGQRFKGRRLTGRISKGRRSKGRSFKGQMSKGQGSKVQGSKGRRVKGPSRLGV